MTERIRGIDVLKGVCILFIIVTHFEWEDSERLAALFPFWIDMAIPVFMMISGYVYAAGVEKKKMVRIGQAYEFSEICKKLIRYTVPFAMAYLLEVVLYARSGSPYSPAWLFITFLQGGVGPGSYYFPIMLQFIFIVPLICFPIRENPGKGLACAFLFNAVYEVLQMVYGFNVGTYRYLLFRYVFLIAFGCFAFQYQKKLKKRWLAGSFAVGTAFLILVCYTKYEPKIITYWTGTSFMAALYIVPIFYLLIRSFGTRGFWPLELLGKASFHIFLTQKIFYGYYGAAALVYRYVDSKALQLLAAFGICLTLGILFYEAESRITGALLRRIKPLS